MTKRLEIKRVRRQWGHDNDDWNWEAHVFGFPCLCNGGWSNNKWLTNKELQAAHGRAIDRSYEEQPEEDEWGTHQCGGCRYYGAFNEDWGICLNEKSPRDLTVMFEHGGCAVHSDFEVVRDA